MGYGCRLALRIATEERDIREEGSLYAIYSFFRKLSQGIGSALVALALSSVGYVESSAVQTVEASQNIKNLYIVFLIIGLTDYDTCKEIYL